MDSEPRLLHLGNVLVDIVLYVPNLPEPGGDVLATGDQITAGGGLNVMAGARRQGLRTTYAGMHGTGPFGDLARAQLAAAGIEIHQPPYPDGDTGFTVALVDGSGERTFATSPGAEARLGPARLADLRPGPADVVYVGGYGLRYPESGPALAGWLATVDPSVCVVVDPGPLVAEIPSPVLDAALDRADWWSCNLREARAMTGAADPEAALAALARRTGRAGVVVRTGPDGCLLATPDGHHHVPGFPVTAVDTNGAGDTHVGAFVAALTAGLSSVDAARRANAAAALAVTRRGPATAPTPAEVDAFLAGHG